MELWIRSQDKERLIKVENLYVEFNGDIDPKLQPYRIVTDKFIDLGIYKDYERALEVLDEIENRIINIQIFNKDEEALKNNNPMYPYMECVYTMPEE